jgi:hypothetical protein
MTMAPACATLLIKVVIFLLFFILANFSITQPSIGNPIIFDTNEAQPEPFGGKYLVYFKQEEIIVTLSPESGKALVNASYVFHNNATNATEIEIKLLFLSKPQVLKLMLDGVSYTNLSWQLTTIFDEVTGTSNRMFESIIFPRILIIQKTS